MLFTTKSPHHIHLNHPLSRRKMTSFSQEILLASSPDGPISAYELSTGTILAHFSGSRSPRKGLALAGKTLIATSHISSTTTSGSVLLYNWWSSTPHYHVSLPEPVAPLAVTPDGSHLFSGGLSGQIYALSLSSGELLRSFPGHHNPITCLTINGDGSLLVSGCDDGAVAVFPILRLLDVSVRDTQTAGFALYRFPGHGSSVTAVNMYDDLIVISSSLDGTCKFWSLANGTHVRTVRFPCMVWCVAVDPAGWNFYAGGSDGRVYAGFMRKVAVNADVAGWFPEHCGAVMAVAVSNGGRHLVSGAEDGSIRVWEVESGRVVRVLGHESGSVCELVVAKGVVGSEGVVLPLVGGGGWCSGFSVREVEAGGRVREVEEMEEWLGVVVKDRRRAIETLEASIGTYERLLSLFLKEAKGEGAAHQAQPTSEQTHEE